MNHNLVDRQKLEYFFMIFPFPEHSKFWQSEVYENSFTSK